VSVAARCERILGGPVVDAGRRVLADARVAMLVVVVHDERLAQGPGVLVAAEALGEERQYVRVVHCAVLEGLSLLTWGRVRERAMPRKPSDSLTGFDVIELARSAWMAS
jgi:hypothetical protein